MKMTLDCTVLGATKLDTPGRYEPTSEVVVQLIDTGQIEELFAPSWMADAMELLGPDAELRLKVIAGARYVNRQTSAYDLRITDFACNEVVR